MAGAQDLIALFLGFELLSIPLYVLRRATSLESGLNTDRGLRRVLVYGLAFIYGATGATRFGAIARSLEATGFDSDVLLLTGVALTLTGLALASVAPFHQWEGAPTAVSSTAVATKAAAFGSCSASSTSARSGRRHLALIMSVLSAITIVLGNVGAISPVVAEAHARLLVRRAGGVRGWASSSPRSAWPTAYYLAVYLMMNLAAFSVIAARERETDRCATSL